MAKKKFQFKIRSGWQECNGNGGSTYSIGCTFYTLFVDGIVTQQFDREWEMYEYINKTYFLKDWKKDLARIKKLESEAQLKIALSTKIDHEMKSRIYR